MYTGHNWPVLYTHLRNTFVCQVWDYYLVEYLTDGSRYDIEIAESAEHRREEDALIDGIAPAKARRVVHAWYDDVSRTIADDCSYLLQVGIKVSKLLCKLSVCVKVCVTQVYLKLFRNHAYLV